MSKQRFSYSGPAQTISVRVTEAETTVVEDIDFVPGATVELLPDHGLTVALLAAEFLRARPADPEPAADRGGRRQSAPETSQEQAP